MQKPLGWNEPVPCQHTYWLLQIQLWPHKTKVRCFVTFNWKFKDISFVWKYTTMPYLDELIESFSPRSAPPGDTSSNIKSEADANNRNSQQWGKIWWLFCGVRRSDGDNFWLRLLLWQSVVYCSRNVPSVSNNHESRQSGIAFVMRGQEKNANQNFLPQSISMESSHWLVSLNSLLSGKFTLNIRWAM